MTINEVSPTEVARMREKAKPVSDKYAKAYGEELSKELFTEVTKVRAANAAAK